MIDVENYAKDELYLVWQHVETSTNILSRHMFDNLCQPCSSANLCQPGQVVSTVLYFMFQHVSTWSTSVNLCQVYKHLMHLRHRKNLYPNTTNVFFATSSSLSGVNVFIATGGMERLQAMKNIITWTLMKRWKDSGRRKIWPLTPCSNLIYMHGGSWENLCHCRSKAAAIRSNLFPPATGDGKRL